MVQLKCLAAHNTYASMNLIVTRDLRDSIQPTFSPLKDAFVIVILSVVNSVVVAMDLLTDLNLMSWIRTRMVKLVNSTRFTTVVPMNVSVWLISTSSNGHQTTLMNKLSSLLQFNSWTCSTSSQTTGDTVEFEKL